MGGPQPPRTRPHAARSHVRQCMGVAQAAGVTRVAPLSAGQRPPSVAAGECGSASRMASRQRGSGIDRRQIDYNQSMTKPKGQTKEQTMTILAAGRAQPKSGKGHAAADRLVKSFDMLLLDLVRFGRPIYDKAGAPILDSAGEPVRHTCPSADLAVIARRVDTIVRERAEKLARESAASQAPASAPPGWRPPVAA
jgi:hypothetical protein